MKAIRFLLLVVSLAAYASLAVADQQAIPENQSNYTYQSSKGDCSPNIKNETGYVTFICIKGGENLQNILNNLPEIKKYNQLVLEIQQIKQKAADLENAAAKNNANASQNRKDLQEIKAKLKDLSDTFEGLVPKVIEIIAEYKITLSKEMEDQLKTISQDNLIQINTRIDLLENRLQAVEKTSNENKTDIALIMKNIYGGKLEDTLEFNGITIGAAGAQTNWAPWVSVEHEWLAPKIPFFDSPGSGFIELSYLDWIEHKSFSTLPGLPSQDIKDDHRHLFLSIGTRIGTQINTYSFAYLGATTGYSITGQTNTGIISLLAGAEYFRNSARIAVEARLVHLMTVAHTNVSFNPFGNAVISTANSGQTILLLCARTSFR